MRQMSQSSACSVSRRRLGDGAHELAQVVRVGDHVAELDQLAQAAVALLQAREQLGVLEAVGDHPAGADEELARLGVVSLARVEDVDQADDVVPGDEREADAAAKAVLGPVRDLALASSGGRRGRRRPCISRVSSAATVFGKMLEVEQLAFDGGVDAGAVDADATAQAALVEMPDVAVLGVEDAAQRRGGRGGEVAAPWPPARATRRARPARARKAAWRWTSSRSTALAKRPATCCETLVRKSTSAPHVALGVVVELDEADHLPADDDRHAQRARVAPLPVQPYSPRRSGARRGSSRARTAGRRRRPPRWPGTCPGP